MTHSPTDHYCRINCPVATVLAEPAVNATCTSEGLFGEEVQRLTDNGGWSHVRLLKDNYEGFVQSEHLDIIDSPLWRNTHRVQHRSTLLFCKPDIKSPIRHRIPFGAELSLTIEQDTPFSRTHCGHYLWSAHCLPLSENHPAPPLDIACQIFLGTPYRWGGRSPEGIDCSGLVQSLALSQGLAIPRDSKDQEAFLQNTVSPDERQAQDIVYWPGHTGILLSSTAILHATAHYLSCVVEPLQAVIDRAGPMSSVKRLF